MVLKCSKSNINGKLILEIPYQNPVSSINYSENTLYVGTYNGFIYKLELNRKDKFARSEFIVKPPCPIRYINITSKKNELKESKQIYSDYSSKFSVSDNKNEKLERQNEAELLLGALFKSNISSFKEPNSSLVPLVEDFPITSDVHCQITEVRSNIFEGNSNRQIKNINNKNDFTCDKAQEELKFRKDHSNNSIPLFLISTVINSYLGFGFSEGIETNQGIVLKPCNYFIPDKELVLLDYDYIFNQLLIVERSPERLDYYNLCSLQIIDLNSSDFGIEGRKADSLLNKPLKFLLNFPNKPHFLVNRNIISELTFNSSIEYKRNNMDQVHYQYNYSTVFLMSSFNKKKLFKCKSIYNVSNAKFWNKNSIVVLISNHLIANILVSYLPTNSGNYYNNIDYITYSKNNFIVKSPDNNYTAISTSNSKYLVTLTEKSRLLIYNNRGEIIYNICNIIPKKYQFKWVWPVNIFISENGFVIFNAFNGIYCVKCDILSSYYKSIAKNDNQQ
ncbi:hypothetical protein FG379_001525 [Cryptosporidium bovis]|uniref:uncharacterized protein n=1 Tax=Cryptosporidium bovis TaxID=310047 RepID=UPI003519F53B|nr:hypothetical protein FG379_001525 [Cryptosporidium bovis]